MADLSSLDTALGTATAFVSARMMLTQTAMRRGVFVLLEAVSGFGETAKASFFPIAFRAKFPRRSWGLALVRGKNSQTSSPARTRMAETTSTAWVPRLAFLNLPPVYPAGVRSAAAMPGDAANEICSAAPCLTEPCPGENPRRKSPSPLGRFGDKPRFDC